ncbi:MAG: glycosyltransferase family 4 protein, partial [Candidatus Odinarchaeia archaeon]
SKFLNSLAYGVSKILEKITLFLADTIISVIPPEYDITLIKYKNKTSFIPDVIDVKRFKKIPRIEEHKTTTLIFSGRLEPEKGALLALKTFYKLHKVDKNIKLKIVGDGILKNEMVNFAKTHNLNSSVEFIPTLPHEDFLKILSEADYLLLSSKTEFMPNVLLEAASLGVPVIAFNFGGIPYLIKNGKNGILVESGNESEYIKKTIEAIKNKELHKKISLNLERDFEKWIREDFGVEAVRKKYLRIFLS